MKISIEVITDAQTGQTIVVDERNFYDCVDFQLKKIREQAAEIILKNAPEYKQRNAALGILSEEETEEIKNLIQSTRNKSNQLEQQVKSIVWDGNESTKTIACDAIQSVTWT